MSKAHPPLPALSSIHLMAFFVLTSSEGDGLEFTREVHFVSESLEIGNWIGTRRKYENQWSGG
jgi:hypothetical protein